MPQVGSVLSEEESTLRGRRATGSRQPAATVLPREANPDDKFWFRRRARGAETPRSGTGYLLFVRSILSPPGGLVQGGLKAVKGQDNREALRWPPTTALGPPSQHRGGAVIPW